MRIAYVSTFPPRLCGIGEYTWRLVNSLRGLGVDITVFSSIDGYKKVPGVRVVPVFDPGRPRYDMLLREVSKGGYDVIHVQHEYGVFPRVKIFLELLDKLSRMTRLLVVTLHTILHSSRGVDQTSYQLKVVDKVDAVIVHSILQEYEIMLQGADPVKITRIPHGTDYYPSAEPLSSTSVTGKNELVYALIGFIRWSKGLDVLAKAFRIAGSSSDRIKLLIAGAIQNPSGKNSLDKLFEEVPSHMHNRIQIINKYLDKRSLEEILRNIDILLFPYREVPGYIPVSGALHMVMGYGKPLICSRVPRLVECAMYASEVLFPPDNPDMLAELMLEFLENPTKFINAGLRLREYGLQWTWDRVAHEHLRLYEKLL